MQLELTDDEVKVLIESLRCNERNSRQGFARWLADHAGNTSQEVMAIKLAKAEEFFKSVIGLRARLGDTQQVKAKANY